MILCLIIGLIAILLITFVVAVLSVSGVAFIIVFGDLIVAIALIVGIFKLFSRRKRNRRC